MRRSVLFIVPALVFAALAVALLFGLRRDPSIIPSHLIGKPVPQFALPPVREGKPGLANTDLNGSVSLVNVFASWCIPCKIEHPILMRIAAETHAPVYGINYKDDPADANRWLDELGDPYRRIGADRDGRTGIDFGVYGVPETFIVDAKGIILYKQVGPITPEALEKRILPLLEGAKMAKGAGS
ncbi:MAG: DsbE family thiol:disulfide interchange protein [Alphaproteobacteria bacterium]